MAKCDRCPNPATIHLTEVRGGKKIEQHLCEACAAQAEGIVTVKQHTPINELLTQFVMQHSGMAAAPTTSCEHCGMTWAEFRQGGLMGCEHDYALFEKDLSPLLLRAHENATHHVGKVPTRRGGGAGASVRQTQDLAKLRKELGRAVETEDYEKAARLRDQIKKAEAV